MNSKDWSIDKSLKFIKDVKQNLTLDQLFDKYGQDYVVNRIIKFKSLVAGFARQEYLYSDVSTGNFNDLKEFEYKSHNLYREYLQRIYPIEHYPEKWI